MADDDANPFGDLPFDGNPFAAMPFLNDMMKSLASQGPLNWDVSRQVAMMTIGSKSANVDPVARIANQNRRVAVVIKIWGGPWVDCEVSAAKAK